MATIIPHSISAIVFQCDVKLKTLGHTNDKKRPVKLMSLHSSFFINLLSYKT